MNRREFIAMGAASGALMLFDQNAFGKLLGDSHIGTMILGGGAFAIGFALTHPEETVVVEHGIHLCADVALTGDFAAIGTPVSPLGRELYQRLERVDSLEKTDAGKDWGQEEKGTTEDEMAGWHHGLNGRESE